MEDRRLGGAQVRDKAHERGVLFVNAAVAGLRFLQSCFKNVLHNGTPLLAEERVQRIERPSKALLQQAKQLGVVPALEVGGKLIQEGGEVLTLIVQIGDAGLNLVVPGIEHDE